ncbi:MAG: hypothetical protein HC849_08675 [Oscillatoriales cyanobacterium RU_3_3]|nr:hypothetical protein [Microcoleus sp. SU_5_6]NJM60235.1 hypothetical protein [Oscillatoriales cyanobacterium RU_3_3]NJR20929.1 hypothetical protein [Richelia sp. CSU_2_1]
MGKNLNRGAQNLAGKSGKIPIDSRFCVTPAAIENQHPASHHLKSPI